MLDLLLQILHKNQLLVDMTSSPLMLQIAFVYLGGGVNTGAGGELEIKNQL